MSIPLQLNKAALAAIALNPVNQEKYSKPVIQAKPQETEEERRVREFQQARFFERDESPLDMNSNCGLCLGAMHIPIKIIWMLDCFIPDNAVELLPRLLSGNLDKDLETYVRCDCHSNLQNVGTSKGGDPITKSAKRFSDFFGAQLGFHQYGKWIYQYRDSVRQNRDMSHQDRRKKLESEGFFDVVNQQKEEVFDAREAQLMALDYAQGELAGSTLTGAALEEATEVRYKKIYVDMQRAFQQKQAAKKRATPVADDLPF